MRKRERRYTTEFKAHAVELVDSGRPVLELAEELGLGADLIYNWVRQSKARSGAGAGSPQGAQIGSTGAAGEGDSADELRALRRENARLKLECDILKKAAIILGTPAPLRPGA